MLGLITNSYNTFQIVVTLTVFITTLAIITSERLPNAIAAMVGAFLVVGFQIISQEEAVSSIDFDTIGLLCGMMITVSIMRQSGLFEYVAIKGIKFTGGNPWKILIVLSVVTAVLSAFLDNVTTVLIIVPLTFAVADTLKFNPLPILISEILFSNIGGTATLIGDPPNIMIGGATHLEFMDFININLPIVIVISIVTFGLLRIIYRKKLMSLEIEKEKINAFDEKRAIKDKRFLIKNLIIFALIIIAFITHHAHKISLASIALGGGFLLMMFTKQDPEKILKEVEWPTLFFFIGLFIIVGALEKAGVINFVALKLLEITKGEISIATQLVLWLSAFSTTFLNSIPYTATMISIIENIGSSIGGNFDQLWWALSLGACLGGNGTTIGAAANIIVAGFSQRTDYPIKFLDYLKIGLPLMFVSVVMASIYLYIRYSLF